MSSYGTFGMRQRKPLRVPNPNIAPAPAVRQRRPVQVRHQDPTPDYDDDHESVALTYPRRRPCEFPPSVFPSEGLNCPGGVCYPPMGYIAAPAPGIVFMGPTVCTPAGCYPTYMPVPAPYIAPMAGLVPYPVAASCPNIF